MLFSGLSIRRINATVYRCSMLDTRCLRLDAGCSMLDARCLRLDGGRTEDRRQGIPPKGVAGKQGGRGQENRVSRQTNPPNPPAADKHPGGLALRFSGEDRREKTEVKRREIK
jgi:hypothetical protein